MSLQSTLAALVSSFNKINEGEISPPTETWPRSRSVIIVLCSGDIIMSVTSKIQFELNPFFNCKFKLCQCLCDKLCIIKKNIAVVSLVSIFSSVKLSKMLFPTKIDFMKAMTMMHLIIYSIDELLPRLQLFYFLYKVVMTG